MNFVDLDEKLKISDFTFGFEMEAVYNDTGIPIDTTMKPVVVDKDIVLMRIKKLESILGLQAKFGGSYMRDGSIKPYDGRHTPFEYVSGVNQFTDQNLLEFTKSMMEMKKKGVYTNSSCGFHIHFGFPDTTRKQLLWIKTVYLFDQIAQDNFEYFQSTQGPIAFWSPKYANLGNKKILKAQLRQLVLLYRREPDSTVTQARINNFFNQSYFTGKYTVLGIHEKYRTLEWRGPRGFLETGQVRDIINFVQTLRKFVKWLSSAEDTGKIVLDSKRGLFVTRQEFFDMIEHHSPERVRDFAADVLIRIQSAKTNGKRAQLAFDFFKTMDLASKSATNYRKIANRIKAKYPTAWKMFEDRVKKERTFPEKIKLAINRFVRSAGLESYQEEVERERVSFRNYIRED